MRSQTRQGGFRTALPSTVCCLLCAALAFAQVPHLIRYQGQAVDSQGVPLEGPYTLTFRLYDAETGGAKVWEETQANVVLQGGHFSVLLGQVTPLTAMDWSAPRWLSVQVGTEPELAPRQRITSVPLAIMAERLSVPVTTSTITDDANRLVPAGAVILWDGASCPASYTRLTAYDNYFLIGSSVAGTTGGSNTHDHGGATGSHTLSVSEIPSHSHALPTDACGSGDIKAITNTDNADESLGCDSTGATGGGGGHTHPISSADYRPPFKTILLCKKD